MEKAAQGLNDGGDYPSAVVAFKNCADMNLILFQQLTNGVEPSKLADSPLANDQKSLHKGIELWRMALDYHQMALNLGQKPYPGWKVPTEMRRGQLEPA